MEKKEQKVAIYQAKSGAIELREDLDHDTMWATQKQIAEIFDVDRTVIVKHIKNIFFDKELDQKVVCANFAHTTKHGAIEGKKQTRTVNYYNLDIILAVGYRTNSVRAIEFRRWANKILGQYITKGYLINPQRIGRNYDSFLLAVEHVQKLLPKDSVIKTGDVLELIKTFAGTWFSLESYDKDRLPHKGVTKKDVSLRASDLYSAIQDLKKDLITKGQATDLFAQEKQDKSLEGILGNVLQSAFGADVYASVEEKAAYLLYFVVKNHPFTDGNKRTGAFAFVWFLQRTEIDFKYKITPETLTTITLLIAESKPRDKDRMIGLILLLLQK